MLQRTADYMEQQGMPKPGARIVLGLSGGADSVCLFHVMRILGYSLEAVHVHHGIRGAEADRDEAFVRALCERYGVSFHGYRFDVPAISREKRLTVEEAGRILRRQAFMEVQKKTDAVCIALAHHGNDRAETFLFHLSRGAGVKGLTSMRPLEGAYIRPLLWAERKEIMQYIQKEGWEFVEDATNQSDDYTRNKIRHQVIPILEEINPKSTAHMIGAIQKLSAVSAYMERESEKLFHASTEFGIDGVRIIKDRFYQGDPVLRIPVLQKSVEYFTGSLENITEEHLQKMQGLFELQTGRELQLPGNLWAIRTYEGIRLFRKTVKKTIEPVQVTDEGVYSLGELTVTVCIEEWSKEKTIPIKNYTKCFDYDKITEDLFFRSRRSGDFLEINKEHGRKLIQDYLVNEKVPKMERDQVLLLAAGNHVLWVVGKRISEYYKVTEKTKKVLKVQVSGGNVHEEF